MIELKREIESCIAEIFAITPMANVSSRIAQLVMDWHQKGINTGISSCAKSGAQKRTRYIPVPDWPECHNWPSLSGLRHLIFYKDTNGFANVIKKVGKSVLIDENAFFEWMQTK